MGPRFIVSSEGLEKPRFEVATTGLQGQGLTHVHCAMKENIGKYMLYACMSILSKSHLKS